MNKYELLYIIDRDVTEENRNACMEMVENTIKEQGGAVSNVDKWGMKKFAYPINYKTEGFYVLVSFEADPSTIKEIERRMRVHDSFVRYMTTSVIENKKIERAKTAKKPERAPRAERPMESFATAEAAEAKVEKVAKVEEVVETKAEEVVAEAAAEEKAE